MKKLLIWDFDGVIADTEHTAMNTWQEVLKYYNINLSLEETVCCILGKGQSKQLEMLKPYNNRLSVDDIKNINTIVSRAVQKNIKLTDDIEKIFLVKDFAQCIATGNNPEGIQARVSPLNLSRYFAKDTLFSANFVKHGKPEPDLFLYAADKMGYQPNECVVIEDSLAGLRAGLKAGMLSLAFVEHAVLDKEKYIEDIKSLGIDNIFYNMIDLKIFLDNLLSSDL